MSKQPIESPLDRPSPLGMITRDPQLNEMVERLALTARSLITSPVEEQVLRFSRTELERVRRNFSRTIIQGEDKLHRLCRLLSESLLEGDFELSSVVIGEVAASKERFTLVQQLDADELSTHTDLDLGNRQLGRLRFAYEGSWSEALLVANFVEYQPLNVNSWGVHKLISRIKAEEEIWNKVVDEIFETDKLLAQDKQLKHLSRYVKDLFGIKILVSQVEHARALQKHLKSLVWSSEILRAAGVEPDSSNVSLEFLEVKDYIRGKESGWSALKSVVRWWDATIEIQIQPMRNYLQERERLTKESHAGFKFRREELRRELGKKIPLYGFYRKLLKWLFLQPESAPPHFPGIKVVLGA